MMKSVEVEAKSKEEALKKGKRKLENNYSSEISKDDLEIKLLSKGKKFLGVFGNNNNKYKIKVKEILEDELDDIVEELAIDGEYNIKFDSEGIFLKVSPPEGEGKKVSLKEVENSLEQKEIVDIDQENLLKTVRDKKNEWVKIAPRKKELDQDYQVEISISKDGFRAFLNYEPAHGGKKINLNDLKNILEENNVQYGINEEKLKEVIEHRVKQKELLIAEGTKATEPEDEELIYHFESKDESIGTELEDGRMDFYNKGLISNVSKGDVLVTIKEAKEGEAGTKVTGEEVPPSEPKTMNLPSGKNVEKLEDERKLVAAIDGQVVKDGKRVNVLPVHEVKGNVDINTGNIEFVGNVLVKGDVQEGFEIKAGGNVEIKGHVSAAQIYSGGDIIIKEGFVGKEKGRLEAKGNIKVRFIENGHLRTKKSIIVSDAIMHSDLKAEEDIIVTENKGHLVGGKALAGQHIEANIIGSSMATKTHLEAGVNQESKEKLQKLEEEIENSERNLLKTNRALKTLGEMKEKYGKLPQDKEIMYQRLLKTNKKINKSIEDKKEEKKEIEKTLENVQRGKIKVNENIYSGVKLIIGNSQLNVHNELRHSSFIEDEGEVRQIPL